MKIFGRITTFVSAAAVTLALSALAGAPGTVSAGPRGNDAVNQGIGRSGPLSKAELARQRELSALVSSATGDRPSDPALARHGFVRVSSGPAVRLASANTDVTMTTPYVYFDTTYARYTAVAKYSWDCTCYDDLEGAVGGPDAFALRFSRSLTNRGVSATFYGKSGLYYGGTPVGNPSDNSSAGVAYTLQDRARALSGGRYDYNMWRGTVTMNVARPACGTTTQLYSRYFHTWASSSVSGVSVSLSGFGVSWTGSTQRWSASSQAGTWKINC